MPISYKEAREKSNHFCALTTLELEEFELLIPPFQEVYEESEKYRSDTGRKPTLRTIQDKLFFILYYLTQYPKQVAMAFQFGMSVGQANYWIHKLTPIIKAALRKGDFLPERGSEELFNRLKSDSNRDYVIDGTERRRQRPKDNERQKKYYSGKKKTHTVKNILIGGMDSRTVIGLSSTCEGKKSDKKITDEEEYKYPKDTNLFQDKGFQGYKPSGVNVFQPKKKPRNSELTKDDKHINSIISSFRVIAEHIISGVKRIRILKDVFRNIKEHFDDLVIEIGCGLHNFRTILRSSTPRARLMP